MKWLDALPRNRQRGSFPRCLLFVDGNQTIVADKLTKLVGLPDVYFEAKDFWMPQGLPVPKANDMWDMTAVEEAKLLDSIGKSRHFLSDQQREELTKWWLAREARNTPNWDIASTCTIGERDGLLLVEAKAHEAELNQDGKPLDKVASDSSKANHKRIGRAISAASAGLNTAMAGWNLSRDSHYQLANRFAWAWKLASMGVPVVLVYLGFICASEMKDRGEPFADSADWSRVVLKHSRNIVPEQAWGRDIEIGSNTIKPLIRVWKQELPSEADTNTRLRET
jgi:hypothetical protein